MRWKSFPANLSCRRPFLKMRMVGTYPVENEGSHRASKSPIAKLAFPWYSWVSKLCANFDGSHPPHQVAVR